MCTWGGGLTHTLLLTQPANEKRLKPQAHNNILILFHYLYTAARPVHTCTNVCVCVRVHVCEFVCASVCVRGVYVCVHMCQSV